ncbi:MAG: TIGR00269 family protein [archaeon]
MNCERCGKESIIRLTYGPHSLCQEHFEYHFEHRVRGFTRTHRLFDDTDTIAVAVSGGKDSVVALNLVRKIMPRNTIVGISIDEGIDGYRNLAITEAVKNYEQLGIEYKIVKLKEEIGSTMQEIVQKTHENKWKENSCTFCGVFRRKYLNAAAREMGADKLVTGHNLDDETQSLCMNFFNDRMEKFARMGPKVETRKLKEWVPRVKPLYNSPEEEVELFAQVKGYPHYSDACCPFSHGADRNIYRRMMDEMEMKKPGTRFSIIRSYLKMKPLLEGIGEEGNLQLCHRCGDLSSQSTCQACVYEERIRAAPTAPGMTPLQINAMGKKDTMKGLPILNGNGR